MPSLTVLHVMNGATGGAAMSTLDLIECLVHAGIGSVAVALDAGASADRARLLDATGGRPRRRGRPC